jgi:hypothetical protein
VNERREPTEEGRRRYPDTSGYHADLSAKEDDRPDLDRPCVCTSECFPRCSGQCGCPACILEYAIFCDYAATNLPPAATENDFLYAYRYGLYNSGDVTGG